MVKIHSTFHSILRDPTPTRLNQIGSADLVIGFTTHSVKPAIAADITRQAVAGVRTYFPHLKTIILNADAGMNTNTRRAVEAAGSAHIPVVASRYTGVLGKGAGVSAILHGALQLNPQAIVILDSHTTGVKADWIPGLATLVLNHQADLVKPRYHWPLPDGALSDLLFYPFTRAVWGMNLRHPAAGDYALSANLARTVLAQDIWQTEVNRFGFDIWLSIFASTQHWRVAQTALGNKPAAPKTSITRTLSIFKEAGGTVLRQLHLRRHLWPNMIGVQPVPTITEFAPYSEQTVTPLRDCTDYIEALALGWMEHRPLWQRIMYPENLAAVEYLASQPLDRYYFPPDLWAKIAYDFAVVYNKGERDPDAVATSLYPLFLGRLASFWIEVAGLTAVGRAGTVSAQAVEFEDHLPYLKYRWEQYRPWIDSGEKR